MENIDVKKEIELIKSKYKIEEGDPLFAFLEVQEKLLIEIKKSNDTSLLNQQTTDLIKMFENMKSDFTLLSYQKQKETEREIDNFIKDMKQTIKKEMIDFRTELKNKELLEDNNKNIIPSFNKLSVALNIVLLVMISFYFIN